MAKQRRMLDRASFLHEVRNRKREPFEINGGTVYVQELSGQGLLEYNEKIHELQEANPDLTTENSLELITLLITKTVCDEVGTLLLNAEDVADLKESSLPMLKSLAEKAMVVSGISPDVAQEATNTLKNPTDTSTSDLPTS